MRVLILLLLTLAAWSEPPRPALGGFARPGQPCCLRLDPPPGTPSSVQMESSGGSSLSGLLSPQAVTASRAPVGPLLLHPNLDGPVSLAIPGTLRLGPSWSLSIQARPRVLLVLRSPSPSPADWPKNNLGQVYLAINRPSLKDLPDQWQAYLSVSAIATTPADLRKISPGASQAILDWLTAGGLLYLETSGLEPFGDRPLERACNPYQSPGNLRSSFAAIPPYPRETKRPHLHGALGAGHLFLEPELVEPYLLESTGNTLYLPQTSDSIFPPLDRLLAIAVWWGGVGLFSRWCLRRRLTGTFYLAVPVVAALGSLAWNAAHSSQARSVAQSTVVKCNVGETLCCVETNYLFQGPPQSQFSLSFPRSVWIQNDQREHFLPEGLGWRLRLQGDNFHLDGPRTLETGIAMVPTFGPARLPGPVRLRLRPDHQLDFDNQTGWTLRDCKLLRTSKRLFQSEEFDLPSGKGSLKLHADTPGVMLLPLELGVKLPFRTGLFRAYLEGHQLAPKLAWDWPHAPALPSPALLLITVPPEDP